MKCITYSKKLKIYADINIMQYAFNNNALADKFHMLINKFSVYLVCDVENIFVLLAKCYQQKLS